MLCIIMNIIKSTIKIRIMSSMSKMMNIEKSLMINKVKNFNNEYNYQY